MAVVKQKPKDPVTLLVHILCEQPQLEGLTKAQIAALHKFKLQVVVAGRRLYKKVPRKLAIPILITSIKKLSKSR